MSPFWNGYIIVLTVINIIGIVLLLFVTARRRTTGKADHDSTGHVWDGDLTELNHPLPRWWFGMFVLSVIFAIGYLALYPGMGNFAGQLGWTSAGAAERDTATFNQQLETLYGSFRDRSLEDLATDPAAVKVGRNVFANNCAACHGSDARGARSYPNLVDNDWLYGGDPDTILASVLHGRNGMMPALAAALPNGGVDEVANYVLSLSELPHDRRLAIAGKPKFESICAACHGVSGKGNHTLGAPDLTDDIWLHDRGDLESIRTAINHGRKNSMPAWQDLIGTDRARLATAWILAQVAANNASQPVVAESSVAADHAK